VRLVVIASVCAACSLHDGVPAPETIRESEDSTSFCSEADARLDVLFVIGDAPSMAYEASTLAQSMNGIATYLAGRHEQRFELRVAVTTTSTCDGAGGEFVTTSCRERLGDFVAAKAPNGRTQDVSDVACTDVCAHESIAREPSLVEGSTTPEVRPWLQLGRYDNLASAGDGADEMTCMVPVGVSGCATETPMAAMQAALARVRDPDDPQYGFLRSDASLLVVIVADGEDVDGDASSSIEVLKEIQTQKRSIDPDLDVRVSVVGGVGTGYENGSSDAVDGCTIADEVTPPTPGLVELAAAFADPGERNAASACGNDYTVVLEPFAEPIRDQLKPLCVPVCLADGDPSTPELDPVCHARRTEIVGDAGVIEVIEEPLHPCVPDTSLDLLPPPGELRCVHLLHGDVIDAACTSEGWNAELRVASIAPRLPAGETCIEVTCRVSLTPEVDCPDL
jgi:hypothetical protein